MDTLNTSDILKYLAEVEKYKQSLTRNKLYSNDFYIHIQNRFQWNGFSVVELVIVLREKYSGSEEDWQKMPKNTSAFFSESCNRICVRNFT